MKDPISGGKKKTKMTYRSADAREGAAKAKAAGDFKKFADNLRATDVSGKGRSAAAGRRQAGLKDVAAKTTGKKLAGYGPSAPTGRGRLEGVAAKPTPKSAAYLSRAGVRKPTTAKKRIPNTK
jgi:hypothetical protein